MAKKATTCGMDMTVDRNKVTGLPSSSGSSLLSLLLG